MSGEKKLTPSDPRKRAQDLIKSGKMPTPERFLQAMTDTFRVARHQLDCGADSD